jgi:hypothetical protein
MEIGKEIGEGDGDGDGDGAGGNGLDSMELIVVICGDGDEQRENSGRRHWWRDNSSGYIKTNGGDSEDYEIFDD